MLRIFSCFLTFFIFFSCSKINVYKEATFSNYYKNKSSKILIDVRTPEEFKTERLLNQLILIFIMKVLRLIYLKFQKIKIFIYTADQEEEVVLHHNF